MFNNNDNSSIRYWPRLNIWANNSKNARVYTDAKGNFTFATSYGHWTFFKRIGKKNVLNTYYYSSQTRDHQNALERLLKQKKIKIHVRVEVKTSLGNLNKCLAEKYRQHCEWTIESENTRKRADNRKRFAKFAKQALNQCDILQSIGARCNRKEIMRLCRIAESIRLADAADARREGADSRKKAHIFKKELLNNSWINVA